MDDTDADRKAIQPVINQIVFYPLSEYDGTMKTVDWSKAPEIPGPKSSLAAKRHGSCRRNSSTNWAKC